MSSSSSKPATKKPTKQANPNPTPKGTGIVFNPLSVISKFKKDPRTTKDCRKDILNEMHQVLENIATIEEAAKNIDKKLQALQQPLNLNNFNVLTRDLKTILRIIGTEMESIEKGTTSKSEVKLPTGVAEKAYDNFCPLVVFLQALAASLTPFNIQTNGNSKGDIGLIWNIVHSMEDKLNATKVKFGQAPGDVYAGLAACTFIHAENGTYTVEGTAPRYTWLEGLGKFATGIRNKHIEVITSKLSEPDKHRVAEIVAVSKQAATEARAPTNRALTEAQFASPTDLRVSLSKGTMSASRLQASLRQPAG